MKHPRLTLAGLVVSALAFAAPLAAQTLTPMVVRDTSPEMRAAFNDNLSALGVRVDVGKSFSLQEYFEAQRIMNEQSSPSLKTQLIQNLVNNGNQFDPLRR